MTASMRQRTDIGITTGWKRHRPGLELGLTVIATCFIPLAVAVTTGVGGGNKQSREVRKVPEHGGNGDTCFTAACNDTATMILNNMDRTVDPCDNFYMYACGGYLNSAKIPDGEDFVDSYSSTKRKVYAQLRAIVEAEIEPNEPKAYKMVKKYYRSCINESAIEARGVQPLLANLRKIGGWPMIEGASWNESNFAWTKAIYELRKSGHSFENIIHFHVHVSRLNRTEHAIYINPPPRSRVFYDSKMMDTFNQALHRRRELILDVAIKLGAQVNTGTKEELEEIIKFESNLLTIPVSKDTIDSIAATPMTLTELKRNYPSIPWQEYICAMLSSAVSIPINEVMIVEKKIYFAQLDKLISNTSKRVLANYIAYNAALDSMKYVRVNQQSLAAPEGNTGASAIWKMCIKSVSRLPFALESMYMSRHFSADARNHVVSIMDDVWKAIRKMLETNNWLDKITKSQALRKLDERRGFITPAYQLSDDKLDKIYETVEMDEEKYYENCHKILLFNTEYSLRKLREPFDKRALIEIADITDVRAIRLHEPANSYGLTVGMLQDNFFSIDRPRYMNYGAIGGIIGREIIYAFDYNGRRVNAEGKYDYWWQPSSERELIERAQCIVDQYSKYTVQKFGPNGNGAPTLQGSIADNGGTKGAYLAYSNWVAKNGEEPKLPGINMTTNQLFWMSRANIACARYTHKLPISPINGNILRPHEFEIIGSMSSISQFATDFKCPPGSKMNPTEKCSIW